MKLFINAGGKGDRIRLLTYLSDDIPKPMVEICGKPVLHHLVDWAKLNGINEIVMMNGYKHEKIIEYFGDGNKFGIKINHSNEPSPLGSGGPLKYAKDHIDGTFVHISGDHICDIDLKKMMEFHKKNNSQITILVHKSSHPHDSDILNIDHNGKVLKFISKHDDHTAAGNLTNAGLAIIEPEVMDLMEEDVFNFENYLYPILLKKNIRFYAYNSDEFFHDMGTVERLKKCEDYIKNKSNHGISIEKGIIKTNNKTKAIILAGGFGTRITTIASEVPKPMIFIAGKPLLEHQIILLKEQGIKNIIITIHHMGNVIKSYFGDGSKWGVDITYSEEEIPLGTAGAIKNAEKYIDDTFIVLNGNAYSHINIDDMMNFHKMKRNIATLALSESKDTEKYGNVILEENKIIEFAEKEVINTNIKPLINSGFYIFEPAIFDLIEEQKNVSLEREIFPKISKQRMLGGYLYDDYFMDITRPETYFKFKKDILKGMCLNESDSIKEAMKTITKNGIDLVLVIDENEKLLGILNDRIIKNFLLEGGGIDKCVCEAMVKKPSKVAKSTDDREKIYDLLLESRHLPILDNDGRIVDVEFRVDKIKLENFPVIRGKAPFRISFAGGGTDLPNFFEKYGGVVINCTIDKYCYGTLVKRADSKVVINSDFGDELVLNLKEKIDYNGKFDLIKAIINIMKPNFGFELYLHNDIPPGRGLGSSATLAILIVRLISTMQDSNHDDYKIAEIAYKAETQELKIKGGWQDQYAAVTGGFNFMEFNGDKTLVYPLRLKEEVINELNHHLLLCYVGKSHFSGDQQEVLEKSISDEEVLESLNDLKDIAIDIKDCLLTNNIEEIGRLLHKSWENKKKVSKTITNPKIDRLYEVALLNGAYGGKLLGAGGGGYLLIFHTPNKRNQLVKALQNEGGEITDFNFEFNGARVWTSKNKNFCA